jgi:hypothetical protein
MNASEFAWTFPLYIIVGDCNTDPDTGRTLYDDKLRFITPEAWPGGPTAIAIFTDWDLAETYRQKCQHAQSLRLLDFPGPAELKSFLEAAHNNYQVVVVDVNRQTRRAQTFYLQEVIDHMDHLDRQEDTGDQS